MSGPLRPNVFRFDNYRTFLAEWYHFEKSTANFSYRQFSARAGFKSPNFIKLVIDGKRNITTVSLRKLIAALKLSADEGSFFGALVRYNQSEFAADRARYAKDLAKFRLYREVHPINNAIIQFYHHWYSVPLREMIGGPGFKEDLDLLAEKFLYKVTPKEIGAAIDNMLALGIIRRSEDGTLQPVENTISTGNEIESLAVANFHRQMIAFGAESIDRSKRHERDISGLTISLSPQGFARLKEMIQDFRKSLLAEAGACATQEAVYQINIQFFPLTKAVAPEKTATEGSPMEGAKWPKAS